MEGEPDAAAALLALASSAVAAGPPAAPAVAPSFVVWLLLSGENSATATEEVPDGLASGNLLSDDGEPENRSTTSSSRFGSPKNTSTNSAAATAVSPSLSALLASQRTDRSREIALLSPPPPAPPRRCAQYISSSASKRLDRSSEKTQPRRDTLLFSPTNTEDVAVLRSSEKEHQHSTSKDVNLSASSLESIGKISDVDLLSPIPQTGGGPNRMSAASGGGNDDEAEDLFLLRVVVSDLPAPRLRNSRSLCLLCASTTNHHLENLPSDASMQSVIQDSGLPDAAKKVFLRFQDELEGDEAMEPAVASATTPIKEATEPVLSVHESLLSPCPTIFEEEKEGETTDDDDDDGGKASVSQDSATNAPSNRLSSGAPEKEDVEPANDSILSHAETLDAKFDDNAQRMSSQEPGGTLDVKDEADTNSASDKENDSETAPSSLSTAEKPEDSSSSSSPLQSIRTAESRRSFSLIQRLRSSAFRRRMNVSAPDAVSLSLLEDEPPEAPATAMSTNNADHGPSSDSFIGVPSPPPSRAPTEARDLSKPQLLAPVGGDDGSCSNAPSSFKIPPTAENHVGNELLVEEIDGSFPLSASRGSLDGGESAEGFRRSHDASGLGEEDNVEVQLGREDHIRGQTCNDDSVRSRDDEIHKTKQGLGASSMAFIEQLRGAALRRKMNLSRSRDSLAAKERKQREDIAASEAARLQKEELDRQAEEADRASRRKSVPARPSLVQTFKARPLPQTSGLLGSGGLSGVPKVEKKPTTTPISPFLGSRRDLRQAAEPETCDYYQRKSVTVPVSKQPASIDTTTFKARPLPKTTGVLGGAGQAGVPKVPKRQATVPFSPLLGPRRKTQQRPIKIVGRPKLDNDGAVGSSRRPSNSSMASQEVSRSSGQSLLGVAICSQKENHGGEAVSTPRNAGLRAFIPRSTARAQKRADFEEQRKANEQQRKEEERRERNERLKALRKELQKLRSSI